MQKTQALLLIEKGGITTSGVPEILNGFEVVFFMSLYFRSKKAADSSSALVSESSFPCQSDVVEFHRLVPIMFDLDHKRSS